MTMQQWISSAASQLKAADISTAQLDAELLLSFVTKKSKEYAIAHADNKLSTDNLQLLQDLLQRRLAREPIAYIVGYKEFYGRDFTVTPDTLIPRPETEAMIGIFAKHNLQGRILDVGTGSGCIGLSLKAENPTIDLTISDISLGALAVARKNAQQLGIKPVRYIKSDLLDHWLSHTKPKKFDVVVANLPYVDASWQISPEAECEPDIALFSTDKGLAHIKKLLQQSTKLLLADGHVLLELDPRQQADVAAYAQKLGFTMVEQGPFTALYRYQA